jgi:hypothetical protein
MVFLFYAIDIAASATLAFIAALHLYWAAGGLWPARSQRQLIDTVIGDPHRDRMPPAWITALVGFALAGAAMLPLMITSVFWSVYCLLNLPPNLRLGAFIATFLAGLGFLARGIIGYLPFWRRLHTAEPFASLDVRLYSPLCLALGLALLLLESIAFMAMMAI